jgi:hypothetical protein
MRRQAGQGTAAPPFPSRLSRLPISPPRRRPHLPHPSLLYPRPIPVMPHPDGSRALRPFPPSASSEHGPGRRRPAAAAAPPSRQRLGPASSQHVRLASVLGRQAGAALRGKRRNGLDRLPCDNARGGGGGPPPPASSNETYLVDIRRPAPRRCHARRNRDERPALRPARPAR